MKTHPAVLLRREFWFNHLSWVAGPTPVSNEASLRQVQRYIDLRDSLSRAFDVDPLLANEWWDDFTGYDPDRSVAADAPPDESDGDAEDDDIGNPQTIELRFPGSVRIDIDCSFRSLAFSIWATGVPPMTNDQQERSKAHGRALREELERLKAKGRRAVSEETSSIDSWSTSSRSLPSWAHLGEISRDVATWALPAFRWHEAVTLASRATGPFATNPSTVQLLLLPGVWPSRGDCSEGHRTLVEEALVGTGLASAHAAADYSALWWEEVCDALEYEWTETADLGWVTTAESSTRNPGRTDAVVLQRTNSLLLQALGASAGR